MKNLLILFIILLVHTFGYGQKVEDNTIQLTASKKNNYRSFIIPGSLIGFGFVGLKSDRLKKLNFEIMKQLNKNGQIELKIDDYSQYVPFLSVYGLNAIGLKGKNSFKNRTFTLGTAYIIMGASVTGIKRLTAIRRPDDSASNSFPSGHTATAFMGAEFLYQEYKDESIWYGVSGYAVAAATGYLRLNNNRHWFTDIVTGAGMGILSTKIAYWICPWLKEKLFKNKKEFNGIVTPLFSGKKVGLGLTMSF